MSDTVHCVVVGREAEALDKPPYPGELGQRIQKNVSKEGWQQWMAHQTRLINEMHLSPINPKHREYLEKQMEAFLFGGNVDQPAGYVPPDE